MNRKVTLRQWQDDDLEPFAAMNADPEVMQFFLKPLTRDESKATLDYFRTAIDQNGWGLWAVDVDGVCAGFTGLQQPTFSAPFTPCNEIGWRLRREFWGQGIAYAAALQAEAFAFNTLRLSQLVSFTAAINLRSRRLMERLGFSHDPRDDFLHPRVAEGHLLRPHVLYKKSDPRARGSSVRPLIREIGPS